jgi:transmembrane sensor
MRRSRPAKRLVVAPRRSWLAGAAAFAAASIALYVSFDGLSTFLRSDYSTGTGETQRVTLADGSRVELDAQSAIAVQYGAGQRRLTLLEGEA